MNASPLRGLAVCETGASLVRCFAVGDVVVLRFIGFI